MNSLEEFESLFSMSPEEQIEHDASMLAFQFLSKVDQFLAKEGISKKELAQRINTSASFITQMFRGNRKPSWKILAKMQAELDLEFKVFSGDELIANEIRDYHKKWNKRKSYSNRATEKEDYHSLLYSLNNIDFALAG